MQNLFRNSNCNFHINVCETIGKIGVWVVKVRKKVLTQCFGERALGLSRRQVVILRCCVLCRLVAALSIGANFRSAALSIGAGP